MSDQKIKSQGQEFASILLDLDKGRVHDDCGDLLRQVIAAVEKMGGGKGSITLKVTAEPQDANTFIDTGVMLITAKVTADIPRPARAPSIFYTDGMDKGQLTRQDPRANDPFRDND
jgi:hypothetical protein